MCPPCITKYGYVRVCTVMVTLLSACTSTRMYSTRTCVHLHADVHYCICVAFYLHVGLTTVYVNTELLTRK